MKDSFKYALGLDIGTTSIGWSVVNLDKNRIEDLGVRIFEKPENPKNGKSLAEPRRAARSARRRLKRRRQRLNYLKDFFVKQDLLSSDRIEYVLSPEHNHEFNPYELREKGLEEKLEPEELFVALYHIAKRRGYKPNRRSLEESDDEGRKVLGAINANKPYLTQWQTVGRTLNNEKKFEAHKRNKRDDYSNSFIRQNFLDEIRAILHTQQQFYPQLSDDNIQLLLMGDVGNGNKNGIFYQRPFMTDELINKMRGKCSLEKDRPRAPKASYSFELFRLSQDLAHLSYTLNIEEEFKEQHQQLGLFGELPGWSKKKIAKGEAIFLTSDEIRRCIDKCKSTQKVTYKAIREVLGYKNDPAFNFTYIRGKDPKKEDAEKDPLAKEKNTFAELKFYHAVKKAAAEQPEEWQHIESDIDLFDKIGEVITCNKSDETMQPALQKLGLSEQTIDELMKLNFAGFGHISTKAARKITPHLLLGDGMTYDKAMEAAGYHFAAKLSGDKMHLPPLNEDEAHQITNPVVKRAISQTIKVVNAIIRKYGSPYRIGVECAGELSKNFKERNEIKKAQDENAATNEKIIERLRNEFNITNPTGLQISKMKFYLEQDGKCLYSGNQIDTGRLFSDANYCEIDHIIPFSRCGNDSRTNKALVLNKYNQEKGNLTPYEKWGSDEAFWRSFEARVNANDKLLYPKKRRLLAKTPPAEGWRDHAINDTRYISKFISRYLRNNLKFNDEREGKQKVIVPTGAITTYLRRMWRIPHKDRDADCLHHSVDATIIALVDQSVVADCAKYSAWLDNREKLQLNGGIDSAAGSYRFARELDRITDHETGLVDKEAYNRLYESFLPWHNFTKELMLRESQPKENDNLAIWRDQFRDVYKAQDETFRNSIHPIFVSRMPKRSGIGQVNKETLRSPKTKDNDGKTRSVRMWLTDIKLSDLESSATKDTDPVLYQQLKERLEANGGDGKKAFGKDNPIYKNGKSVDKNGNPISPVASIKVYSSNPESSGFTINNGKAYVNNGSMIRLDIYKKVNAKGKTEHFFVPVYAHQIRRGHPGYKPTKILPEPKGPTDVDETFDFVCSLFPNDYMTYKFPNLPQEGGYYITYDTKGGTISLLPQTAATKDKRIRISARSATKIERLDINVLGDNYPWE